MASWLTVSSPPCWLITEARRSLVSVVLPRPTWNVNAPTAGCPSWEITCHATT